LETINQHVRLTAPAKLDDRVAAWSLDDRRLQKDAVHE
jgi:hypothetical protein